MHLGVIAGRWHCLKPFSKSRLALLPAASFIDRGGHISDGLGIFSPCEAGPGNCYLFEALVYYLKLR
jgi:hypothetical protein